MSEPLWRPAADLALRVALAQVDRDEDITPNIATALALCLKSALVELDAELEGHDRHDREQRAAGIGEAIDIIQSEWQGPVSEDICRTLRRKQAER